MKKYILLLCISFFVTLLNAQEAKTIFVHMPDSLTPLLTSTDKADFIDFLESNMKAEVKNKFDGTSEMTELSEDYIKIQMTGNSTWQMKKLPFNDSYILCVISTACAPACDSNVKFYSDKWEELPANRFITFPVLNDFVRLTNSITLTDFNELLLKVDMLLVKADLSKTDDMLTFTFTTPQYLEDEDAEKLKPYITSPIVYNWVDGTFKR